MSIDTTIQPEVTAELEREEFLAETQTANVGPATCEDEQTLLRYLRQRNRLITETERVKQHAKAIVESNERRLAWLDSAYLHIAADVTRRMLRGKSRSVKTVFGVAGFRSFGVSVEVVDESKIPPELQRTTTVPAKSEINAYFKRTGDVPPGCRTLPAGEEFYAK